MYTIDYRTQEVMRDLYMQLGGRVFTVSTGSRFEGISFDKDGNPVQTISLRRNKTCANKLQITYLWDKDVYKMVFYKQSFSKKTFTASVKKVYENDMVFCDELQEIFSEVTGMVIALIRIASN